MAGRVSRDQVEDAFRPFLARLVPFVDAGLSSGEFWPTATPVLHCRLVSPKISETGPEVSGWEGEYLLEEDYDHATLDVVNGSLDWPETKALETALQGRIGHYSLSHWLQFETVRALLTDRSRPCISVQSLVDGAAEVLANPLAVQFEGRVVLHGIRIASAGLDIVTPRSRIQLRRPEIADIEGMYFRLHIGPTFQRELGPYDVSALATIRAGPGPGEEPLSGEARRLDTLLRLVAVTGARFRRIRMTAVHPITQDLGEMSSGEGENPLETATLWDVDGERLQAMATALWAKLPESFPTGREPSPSPTATAYRRYTDALLRDGAVIERRMASAVMGLEALFLPNDRDGELAYRLRTYVAVAMGSLGADYNLVRRQMSMGYGIRSTYVHGGHLCEAMREEARKKFGSVENLLRTVEDYLRRSIVLYLVLELSKEQVVAALQDATLSPEGRARLDALLAKAAPLIGFSLGSLAPGRGS